MRTTGLGVIVGMLAVAVPAGARVTPAAQVQEAFLVRGESARGVGLGDAFVAVVDDASAGWTNPGALGRVGALDAQASYDWVGAGIGVSHLDAALPLGPGTVGVGLVDVTYGSYERFDANGGGEGTESLSDIGGVVAYAVPNPPLLGGRGSTGLSVEMLSEGVGGSLIGASLGGVLPIGEAFHVGWAFQHFGRGSRGGKLPAVLKAGVAYRESGWTVAVEAGRPLVDKIAYLAVGVECVLGPMALRGGFKGSDQGLGGSVGPTFGLGARLKEIGLDYAFQPFDGLVLSHRLTVLYRLGSSRPRPAESPAGLPENVPAGPVDSPAERP